jgi:hypothetical protein
MLILLLVWVGNSFGASHEYPSVVTERQANLLVIAYEEGTRIGFPETIQSILWQESLRGSKVASPGGIVGDDRYAYNDPNGRFKKGDKRAFGDKSYGICQIRINTAKEILRQYPDLGRFNHDEELLVALLTNDRFNIRLASRYFKMQLDQFKGPGGWGKAVLSYNRGAGGVRKRPNHDPNDYEASVWSHIVNFIRPFNQGKIQHK